MIHPTIRREIAERYHRALPDEIRTWLKGRGIPATLIERYLLGWNGERITIPVFGPERDVLGFRYAKITGDEPGEVDTISEFGLDPELYGWDTLMRAPQRVVVCDGEFDRLILEANGFAAVTSTAGAETFPEEWLPFFEPVKHVYICFRRSLAGTVAAKKIRRLLPRASIVTLPPEVGTTGTVTDFFVGLGRTRIDFEVLLAAASDDRSDRPPQIGDFQSRHKSVRSRAERVKRAVRLHEVVANFTGLQAFGRRLMGHCPFHEDGERSFKVYPETDTYSCSGCGAEGDVLKFVMDKESMTLGQALEALEAFEVTHELYGAS